MSSNVSPEFCSKVNKAFSKLNDSAYGGERAIAPGILSAESKGQIIFMPSIELELWVEHDAHVRFQIVPPHNRLDFSAAIEEGKAHLYQNHFHFVGVQLERCVKRGFPNFKVQCGAFGLKVNDMVARNSDITKKGMDMFDITIHNANHDEYIERLAFCMAHLDKIMSGKEKSLES